MKGRKPKPVEQKALEGNPGKRPLAPPARIGEAEAPAPPEHLGERAAGVWNEIVPELAEVGLARTIDGPALEALCTFVARARIAAENLAADDDLVAFTEKGTPVVSPWVRIERDSWASALKIAEHYGLTPISRTRLGIAALQQKSLAQELGEVFDGEIVDADVVEG